MAELLQPGSWVAALAEVALELRSSDLVRRWYSNRVEFLRLDSLAAELAVVGSLVGRSEDELGLRSLDRFRR